MTHPITSLVGRKTGMGTITRAAHDGWALYVDFNNLGWLRVPISELRRTFGQAAVDAVTREAGKQLDE
jgi:hypothetical protein